MLHKINLEHILFLDIETVPEEENFNKLDETKKELWEHKSHYQRKDEYTAEEYYDRAEFGQNLERSLLFPLAILIIKEPIGRLG